MKIDGIFMPKTIAATDSQIFHDSERQLSRIPRVLRGSEMFQLSWNDVNNSSFSVSCVEKCEITVALWEHDNRQDILLNSLLANGWILKKGQQVAWKIRRTNGYNEHGITKGVFSKIIPGNQTISFAKPEYDLPVSVFKMQGMISFFFAIIFFSSSIIQSP